MNQSIAVLPAGLSLASSSEPASSALTSNASQRFLKLPHPRTGAPSLYLPASRTDAGDTQVQILLEVQAINATGDRQRSWFVGDDTVVGDGKMLLLTPFDPVFLLVRILLVVSSQKSKSDPGPMDLTSGDASTPKRSLPYDDIFESAAELMRYPVHTTGDDKGGVETDSASSGAADMQLYDDMTAFGRLDCVKAAATAICQVQEIHADLSTYRLDLEKLLAVLRGKVAQLATKEAFEASPTLARLLAKEGVGDGQGISPEVQLEARQRAALDILAGFLPKDVTAALRATYTFPHLAAYLESTSSSSVLSVDYLPGMSTPALSAASSSSSLGSLPSSSSATFGMRRSGSSGSMSGSTAGDSKKRKPAESNGVRQLKKASTRGMSPLTSFFQKKPTPSPTPSPGLGAGSATPP